MHCDMHWTAFLVLCCLAVSSRAYTKEELNSVTLVLGYQLPEVEANPEITEILFDLIVNFTTLNCSVPRQNCVLIAQYYRNTGPYKRNITKADYVFTTNGITELKQPEAWVHDKNDSKTGTAVIFNLRTYTSYDFLKWTELVRIIYYYRNEIETIFKGRVTGNLTDVPLFIENPTSYIAKVIDDNITTPTIIACVILGSALILFIILIPLSNTKHCRKELDEDYVAPEQAEAE